MKNTFNPIITTADDGLVIPEVGSWSEEKYKLVGGYCDVFTHSMQNKWSHLVYIDLFAGSGFSKIKGTGRIVYGSPLIALSLPIPFTKYILCENDKQNADSLNARIKRIFPDKLSSACFITGDVNDQSVVTQIKDSIPKYSQKEGVLSFCFVDPFSLELNFKTIEMLGAFKMDFLILLALHMDGNRNYVYYIEKESNKIELFLNDKEWREKLKKKAVHDNESFVQFLANSYKSNMERLGYKAQGSFYQVRSDKKNLPLYYLAFFSKNDLGKKFWEQVQKYSISQGTLNF
jgi:three-Cys-motif partner protein